MNRKLIISVPVNNKGDHCTMLYMTNLTQSDYDEAICIYNQLVVNSVSCDKNNRYMISWDNRRIWGANSILLDGPIDDFKKLLHSVMIKRFGPSRISWRQTHFDVKVDYNRYLYPSFNMKNYKLM